MGAPIWDLSRSLPASLVEDGTIGIGAGISPAAVINLVVDKGLKHVVQRDSLAYELEVQCAQNIIAHPGLFLKDPMTTIFGAENQGNFTDFTETASADEKKKNVLHLFHAFLQGLEGSRSIRDDAIQMADELYTNGAKNALPLVSVASAQKIVPGWIQFIARSDGQRLVLGCIDSYGLLDVVLMTKKIQGVYRKGVAGSIQQGRGGAGIGSYMVFNSCTSFYVGVEKGHRSVVLCSLPLGRRQKETVEIPKNIHTLFLG